MIYGPIGIRIDFTQPLPSAFFSEHTAVMMPFGRQPSLSLFALIANHASRRSTRLQRASSPRCLDQYHLQQALTTAAHMDQGPPREVGLRARTKTARSNLPTGPLARSTPSRSVKTKNCATHCNHCTHGNHLLQDLFLPDWFFACSLPMSRCRQRPACNALRMS